MGMKGWARLPLPRHCPHGQGSSGDTGLRRGIALSWVREAWPPRPWPDPELDCSRKTLYSALQGKIYTLMLKMELRPAAAWLSWQQISKT